MTHQNHFLGRSQIQYSAKRWRLGCDNSPPRPEGARTRFTQAVVFPFLPITNTYVRLSIMCIHEEEDILFIKVLSQKIGIRWTLSGYGLAEKNNAAAESAWTLLIFWRNAGQWRIAETLRQTQRSTTLWRDRNSSPPFNCEAQRVLQNPELIKMFGTSDV